MARIRGKDNKETELALAGLMRREGITGWRRHQPVFGKPDFVFPRERVAVFVDGCFWHGCPRHGARPKQNRAFWARKLAANAARDRLVTRELRKRGWRVVRIWEHALRPKEAGRTLGRLRRSCGGRDWGGLDRMNRIHRTGEGEGASPVRDGRE